MPGNLCISGTKTLSRLSELAAIFEMSLRGLEDGDGWDSWKLTLYRKN